MTSIRTADVRCPGCGETHPAQIAGSINVSLEPALKAELLSSRIFQRACPSCGKRWHASQPLLYHDMANLLLLWLYPGELTDEARGRLTSTLEGAVDADLRAAYTMRLVTNPLDLIEKVLIFGAGLSDMTVEVLKIMAEGLAPAARGATLRFSPPQESNFVGKDLPFAVVRPGEKVSMLSVPWAHYQMVTERYPGLTVAAEAAKGDLISVDQGFALGQIRPAARAKGP